MEELEVFEAPEDSIEAIDLGEEFESGLEEGEVNE